VQLLENGEILVSTRRMTWNAAQYVVEVFKRDQLLDGWTEVSVE